MTVRPLRTLPSRLLALLAVAALIIVLVEKLDNRIYVGEVPAIEIPLALNGDLVLARTGETFLVNDARDGTTTTLPQPDMQSKTYRDEPICAAGDQIVFQRTIEEQFSEGGGKNTAYTNVYDRFQWSASDMVVIATHESSAPNSIALDPWTCQLLPEGTTFSYRFEDGQYGPGRTVVILGGRAGYRVAALPDHIDAGELERSFGRTVLTVPAVGSERFLIHEGEQFGMIVHGENGGVVPARDELWIVADNNEWIARQLSLPKGRWLSNPVEDRDSILCGTQGCDVFRDETYALAGNGVFVILSGKTMFARDAGIHRIGLSRPEAGWEQVLSGAVNLPVLFSPDGCRVAVSDGAVRIVELCE